MYFSNVVIDRVAQKLPEIFNFNEDQPGAFKKKDVTDAGLKDSGFPVEPVLWPSYMAPACIEAKRGNGALAVVHGGGDGLVVQLNTGTLYDSFVERMYLQGAVTVNAQTGSVLDGLEARSMWTNVADNVTAPIMGGAVGPAADAALGKFVKGGKHVEGLAARLVALALEHALVPFTTSTRIRNAAACYWCTGKARSDGVTYSLQSIQALAEWTAPDTIGEEIETSVVVWVGNADRTMGMSLLSRIMDEGGPMLGEEAHICGQFEEGRLLMVGTGVLTRDFKAIRPVDLMRAVDEALWILVTYNCLDPAFIRNALRLLIRNLPIVDLAHLRESSAPYWVTRGGLYGDPEVPAARVAALQAAVQAEMSVEARAAVSFDNPDIMAGVLSDLYRREVLAPPGGVGSLAPGTVHAVTWQVSTLLGCMQSPTVGAVDAMEVHVRLFDPTAPPVIANIAMPEFRDMADVALCFSGRAAYCLYAYSQAAVGGVTPVPAGWAVVPAQPADLVVPPGVLADGEWLVWRGGNDAAGAPLAIADGLRAYYVRQWVPATKGTDGTYLNGHTAPPSKLKTFDLDFGFSLGVRRNGLFPDMGAVAPGMTRFVAASAKGGDPLDYLTADTQRMLGGLDLLQKSLALVIGVAYCWEAHRGAHAENDAFARWVDKNRADCKLTTVPDELKLYLGGVRSRKYLESCGGLWTLCYQPKPSKVLARAGHEGALFVLGNQSILASYIMKLRAAVEVADQMCRVSNCRLVGCEDPFLWDDAVDERLFCAGMDQALAIDPATYLARQACMLAAVFDHPDAAVVRTFGVVACGTMRLRECTVGVEWERAMVKHMNWVTPQTLGTNAWMHYFGTAHPSFVLDGTGRALLSKARFSGGWSQVDPDYCAGAMIDDCDEIWCGVLTSYVGDKWLPAAVELPEFGPGLAIDVGDVRERRSRFYSPIMMRLNLPFESRLRAVVIEGADISKVHCPVLPCDASLAWGDQHGLPKSCVAYDADGMSGAITVVGALAGYEVVDFHSTRFACDGLKFKSVRATQVMLNTIGVTQCIGEFWLLPVASVRDVSPGTSAGAQRLLAYLDPVLPVAAGDDGGGGLVTGVAAGAKGAPDVSKMKVVPGTGTIATPLREVAMDSDMMSLLGSLSTMSVAERGLMMAAFGKMKDELSAKTDPTVGTTASGRKAEDDEGDPVE